MDTIINKENLVFPEESFKIIGASFNVFNELGYGMNEKYYQRALEEEFKKLNLAYKREVLIKLLYNGKSIGRYFADFIINNNILLELKVVSRLGYAHYKQVLNYLESGNLKLGILIYFTKDGVKYRRVLNSHYY